MKTKSPFRPGLLLLALSLPLGIHGYSLAATVSRVASDDTIEKIQSEGRARVIVQLRTQRSIFNEFGLSNSDIRKQRTEIAAAQQRVRNLLKGTDHNILREYRIIPYVALEIDAAGLAALQSATLDVELIYEDRIAEPFLADSILQIEGDLALQSGLDGTGGVVAIADTGVDKNHPFLAGKVIEEACYALADDGVSGDCPNGQPTQTGSGSGVPCTFAQNSCRHGTHVAGIAAGAGSSFSGVAPGANLISIQVFHASLFCGFLEETPCARAFSSDIAAALERVFELSSQYNIAAVNLSLGGGSSTSNCDADHPQLLAIMDNLKAAGVATVVASGNGGVGNAISWPSCISTAISVAAVDDNDAVASFSNVSDDLDLFAPGVGIESSVPGGGFASFSGTSMATPHVAGAWAIMEQADSTSTVDDILTLFETTGRPITDGRTLANIIKPRIRLGGALGFEYPQPVLTSVAPTTVIAWRQDTNLTITGADFSRATIVYVDGNAAPTIYVRETELTAILTPGTLETSATSFDISLFTPPPGGGSSATIQINVLQPTMTVNAATVSSGDSITVNLANGPGGEYDWLAFANTGDPDTTYSEWVFIGQDVTSFDWTISAPTTRGSYEFRLFKDGGFTRIATSPTVSVEALLPGISSISPTRVLAGGADFTVTVTGSNFVPESQIQVNGVSRTTTFQSNSELRAIIPASDIATAATSIDISVYTAPPGGGVSGTIPLAIAHPTLAVSATAVDPGDPVTVTLTDGPGGTFDWLALANVTDPDATYSQWTYVASGATTDSWTLNMPTTAGNYEVRLFGTASFTRLATSATITVGTGGPPPDPDPDPDPDPTAPPSLSVDASLVNGGDAVTVTLADGLGNSNDWLALAAVGDSETTYAQWTYIGAGVTSFNWTVNMPATPGDYEFRLFENGGFTRIATSPAVTVVDSAPPDPDPDPDPTGPPSLAVSATSVNGGDTVTVTLSDGAGGAYDWIALATVGDPETTYTQWTYIGAGVTSFNWTVNMPTSDGDYEFRLFENGGFTRIATSPTVTVGSGTGDPPPDPDPTEPPTLEVSDVLIGPGGSVTVTLSNGAGGSLDWIALAAAGASGTSYLQWTYVGAGVTTFTWTVNMPTSDGDYEFRLFENGGYTRLATSPTVTVQSAQGIQPSLDVSTPSATGGESVTVTLSDGPGNNYDWLALAGVGDPDSTYLQWIYVSPGATTASWTVTMPATPGDYEFRLFENGGFTRIATSPTVVVTP